MHKLLMIAFIAVMVATPALADIVAISGPIPSGSWGYEFSESDVGLFTQMEIYRDSSVGSIKFEAPVFRDFSSGGWSSLSLDERHAVALGSPLEYLKFNVFFTGASSESLAFDFVAFHNDDWLETAYAVWNGSSWTITPLTKQYTRTAVPEGFTWPLMCVSSLIALAGLARRRAKGC